MTLDFNTYINEKTKYFIGREWVFKAINNWLAEGKSRIFLLAGDPGTGKSSIAAKLAQMSAGIIRNKSFSELKPGWLSYYHFCQYGLESTLSPLTFVQSLSEALANRFPSFRTALASAGSSQIIINTEQNVGTVQSGGQVAGVMVRIEIKGGDARPMFDLAVRIPMQTLLRQLPSENIIILIDSLDEALTFNAENNIVQLLKLLNDFPPQVRFICTCRAKNERVIDITGQPTLDLITNTTSVLDEVKLYGIARLQPIQEPQRSEVADLIARKSNGNFLYAYHILNDLLSKSMDIVDPDKLDLPNDLKDVYSKFIKREMATNTAKWNDIYRPLLGLIAVDHGNGLTKMQLIGITKLAEDTADEVLEVCSQYLVGGDSENRPYRIYHQSFRDFLLEDTNYSVFPAVRNAAIANYLQEQYGSNWGTCNDEYALRYTPTHWADAATMSETNRESRAQALIDLTQNLKYQRSFERRIGNIGNLKEHMHRAVNVAVLCERVDMLPWLIKAALGYDAFHRNYLQGETVVKLAIEGKADQAETRLLLFPGIDEDWQLAARLIIAWLIYDNNPNGAEVLLGRIRNNVPNIEPLPLLLNRIEAAFAGQSKFPYEEQASLGLEVGQEIVKRISGQEFNRNLLGGINLSLIVSLGVQTEMINQKGYMASFDAPILVDIARVFGSDGTVLLDEYIHAHSSYNYVEYRNRSLWIVLHAVLRYHPDQVWVKERLRNILVAALTGRGADFKEMLPLTTVLLLKQAKKGDTDLEIKNMCSKALLEVNKIQIKRGSNDSWGNHKRRLTSLMELNELLCHDTAKTNSLLNTIRVLPGGFAGFQAPSFLRLADALNACSIIDIVGRENILKEALRSAHHIQDYHFCARVTARCNALIRWHRNMLSGHELSGAIHRFAASTTNEEFAPDHYIHESYQYRNQNDPDILPIWSALQAETLEQLVEVFQVSAVDFRRLNPQFSLTQKLVEKTLIRVPDPGFAPLLAVHFAARVLGDKSLNNVQGTLLRKLVPIAASNSTALDTVLSYLLIASQPDDTDLLEEIARETGPVVFSDITPSTGQIGPDAVIPT